MGKINRKRSNVAVGFNIYSTKNLAIQKFGALKSLSAKWLWTMRTVLILVPILALNYNSTYFSKLAPLLAGLLFLHICYNYVHCFLDEHSIQTLFFFCPFPCRLHFGFNQKFWVNFLYKASSLGPDVLPFILLEGSTIPETRKTYKN